MSETTEQALVVFTPSGRRGSFPIGTSVLDAARDLGVDLDSVCGGRGYADVVRCYVLKASFPNIILFRVWII